MHTGWHNNAVIYGIDIDTFMDANGDGIGDFRGATLQLDYLADLGITCIWLLPFYETPDEDNGYDVSDHCGIDPRLGTFDDFIEFVQEAHKRGIRVIIDLVYHHTSHKHPWFQVARFDPHSPYRDYYVWTRTLPDIDNEEPSNHPAFPGEQADVWHYDHRAKAYYYHRFYPCEPDLNLANPAVQDEVIKIMDFWMSFDIDGFRVDAATMAFEKKSIDGTQMPNPDEFLERMHQAVVRKKPDAILLAEADVPRDHFMDFYHEGKRMHLLFNFILNAYTFASLASQTNEHLHAELERLVKPPAECVWVNFLRNLDELNLEKIAEEEVQALVYDTFSPIKDMRVYDRGIRRRLAPMLEADWDRVKMAFNVMFSLPGSAMFVYGDEIGMGENLSLPGRWAVRTPMQWSPGANAGFSQAFSHKLLRDVIDFGPFSYKELNVSTQQCDDDSLLQMVKKLIRLKKQFHFLQAQNFEVMKVDTEHIFGIKYQEGDQTLMILSNLHNSKIDLELEMNCESLLAHNASINKKTIKFDRYGFCWLQSSPSNS